ncbi:hypothetical protein PybrP1_010631, partial [[Pythium] brassicae (nom. inval.)]
MGGGRVSPSRVMALDRRRSLQGLDENADYKPEDTRTLQQPLQPHQQSQQAQQQAQPLRAANAPSVQRRRSSIVAARSEDQPDALSVLESASADLSLRPRFLKERSATLAQLTGPTEPSLAVVQQSKAAAFLLSVMAKARGSMMYDMRRAPFDPHRGPTTNSLSYSNRKKEQGVPLRLASGPSRRLGLFAGGSSSRSLLSDDDGKAPATLAVVGGDARRSMAALVQELGAHRQQIHWQLDTLHEVLQRLTEAEFDRAAQAQLCEQLSAAGFVHEIISSLREFRFHLGLQMCAMTILSTLTDHSSLYAFAMSQVGVQLSPGTQDAVCANDLSRALLPLLHSLSHTLSLSLSSVPRQSDMELLLHKARIVHGSHERLVVLTSTLLHAISESKTAANARAYKEGEVEKAKRRKATLSEAVAAELKSRLHVRSGGAASAPASAVRLQQQQQVSPKNTPHAQQRQHTDASERHAAEPEEATCGVAERGRVPSRSGSRLRRALAADTAPPVLGANCRLQFDMKASMAPAAAGELSAASHLPSDSLLHKLRPMTSPATRSPPLSLPLSLAVAAYAGAPLFVEPSPLAKRMSSRGTSSASSGLRRRLHFKKRPLQRIPVAVGAVTARTGEETRSSVALQLNANHDTSTRFGADENEGGDMPGVKTLNCSQQPSAPDEGEDDNYDDDTYEDDFMDESEPAVSSRLGDADKLDSDAELIDLLHDLPLQDDSAGRDENDADISTSSDCGRSEAENAAATCIQRYVRGRNARKVGVSAQATKCSSTSRGGSSTREGRSGDSGSSHHNTIAFAGLRGPSPQTKQLFSKRYQAPPTRTQSACAPNGTSGSRRDSSSSAGPSRQQESTLSMQTRRGREQRGKRSKPSSAPLIEPAASRPGPNAASSLHPTASLLGSLEQHEPSVLTPADALKRVQALYSQGLLHHKENRTQQAIASYEAALRVPACGREFASLHINLGSARMAQLEFSAALASFERAERIQPSNVKAAFNCALALMHLGRTAQAREQVGRALTAAVWWSVDVMGRGREGVSQLRSCVVRSSTRCSPWTQVMRRRCSRAATWRRSWRTAVPAQSTPGTDERTDDGRRRRESRVKE